jgi:dynein heavy chain
VATALHEFHNFLGPELKDVTGDQDGINRIIFQVEALIEPFEAAAFDIFDRSYRATWDALMSDFKERVQVIEGLTHAFINTSFQKLRSSEGAFDLLQNFRDIQSRESINRQMMEKYLDILHVYRKELEQLVGLWEQHKDDPPVFKNYPPTAGAIAWGRALYTRAKRPIVKFRTMPDLLHSEIGRQVKEEYLDFARAVVAWEKEQHSIWEEHVSALAHEHLKKPILTATEDVTGAPWGGSTPRTGGNERQRREQLLAATAFDAGAPMPAAPYRVNFSETLRLLIRESKYLDRMGFEVPEMALNVALQEATYHGYEGRLNVLLSNYEATLASMNGVERDLLQQQMHDLQMELMKGFTPLNWQSQRIDAFIESCSGALNRFGAVISQIHKTASSIQDVLTEIERTPVVQIGDFQGAEGLGPEEVSAVMDRMDAHRQVRLGKLTQRYRSIGPLLVKVEEIVAGTNLGRHPRLRRYYRHWEGRLYNAICAMVLRSMVTFQSMMNIAHGDDSTQGVVKGGGGGQGAPPAPAPPPAGAGGSAPAVPHAPLCRVRVGLNGKDLVLSPPLPEVFKFCSRAVRNIAESAKVFVRWMDGTCLECAAQEVEGADDDAEPVIFSFYADLEKNPQVIRIMMALNHGIHRNFKFVEKYLEQWRRYDAVHGLWDQKKRSGLDKLADLRPPCAFFDARLAMYARLSDAVRGGGPSGQARTIGFLHVDCRSVAAGIDTQTHGWLCDYGRLLHGTAEAALARLNEDMDRLQDDLTTNPVDLETLKFVLQTITRIAEKNVDTELAMRDMVERYRTLGMYGLEVEPHESDVVVKTPGRWQQLIIDSKTKDMRMVAVKDKFREVTKNDAVEFAARCKVTLNGFLAKGPGNPGDLKDAHGHSTGMDLDSGMSLLEDYTRQDLEMKRRRKELSDAEGLFNLPITPYPELSRMSADIEKQARVYALYADLKDFEETMSSMLWANLETQRLQKGIEELEALAKQFPKEMKGLGSYMAVEARIVAFREGIPLITALKNDAMKPRHWSKLMETTGVAFDMNPQVFTLRNLFAMELSNFSEDVDEIVQEAMQERKIEEELHKIEDEWKETDFQLMKYRKPGADTDRGFVLKTADEIKLELEDNMLNLQAMSASRYVAAFASEVRDWESKLNVVNECIDIWFTVQRKWMYLESIFIGAEDIRLQLPEEAKSFDKIDKAFITMMADTHKEPNVVRACNADSKVEVLSELSDRLDKCQKSLTDYLDTKRNSFPRFFFLSDDELLSILGSK